MTFKTDTKFDESPVLRSLERVAVERGLVTPDPITKEASAGELYAPTDDLHEDILKLVAGLRAKGFDSEAEALEDRANIRKLAETHLYRVIDEDGDDLLDFAHPEGDVEVAPSASGLGKVWTEQSAKKEILRVVNKQPTGKYASVKTGVLPPPQKTAEVMKILDWKRNIPRLTQDEAEQWITTNTVDLCRNILINFEGKEVVDDLFWKDRGQWVGDSIQELNTKFAPVVVEYLRSSLSEEKHDPRGIAGAMQTFMLSNWNTGTWLDEEGDLWVGELWEAGKSGYIKKAFQIKEHYEQGRRTGDVTGNDLHRVMSGLDRVVTWLDEQKPETESKARAIRKLKAGVSKWYDKLAQIISPTTLEKVTNILGHEWKDITAVIWWAEKTWPAKVKKVVREAAVIEKGIVKKADGETEEGPSAAGMAEVPPAPAPGAAPVAPKAAPPKARSGISNITEQIQQELLNLADYLESIRGDVGTIEILKMKPYGKDKIWGDKTVKALERAELVRKAVAPESPPIAKANTQPTVDSLKVLLRALTGGGAGMRQRAVEVFEDLGEGWRVTNRDLASPMDFYIWSIKVINKKRLYNKSGEEYIKISDFEGLMNGINSRARGKLAATNDDKERQLAARYIRATVALQDAFERVLDYAAKDWQKKSGPPTKGTTGWTTDTVRRYDALQVEYLYSASGGGRRGEPGEPGSGMRQKELGGRIGRVARPGPGGGYEIELIGGEAGEVPPADVPPITKYIDLQSDWWDIQGPMADMVLDFRTLGTGPNFATTYFSEASTEEAPSLYQVAVSAYGADRVRQQPGGEVYIMPSMRRITQGDIDAATRRTPPGARPQLDQRHLGKLTVDMTGYRPGYTPGPLPATQIDSLMRRFQETKMRSLREADPNTRAVNFIRELRSQISRVLRVWTSEQSGWENRRELASMIAREASTWSRKLTRMENDIGRARRRARRQRR